jgi:hypothetical protein
MVKLRFQYKSVKVPLDRILKSSAQDVASLIFRDVIRMHVLTTHVTQFLSLALKYMCENNIDCSSFEKNAIQVAFEMLSSSTLEAYPAYSDQSKDQWRVHFASRLPSYLDTVPGRTIAVQGQDQGMHPNFNNLSYHRGYAVTDVWKNYKNNIILNYMNYVCRFVNVHFKPSIKDAVRAYRDQLLAIPDLPDGMTLNQYRTSVSIAVRRFRSILFTDLSAVKDDLIFYKTSEDFTCPDEPRYRDFIQQHRPHVAPASVHVSWDHLQSLLKSDPSQFIRPLWYMASKIPSDRRVFAFVPVRTSLIPATAVFDTWSMAATLGTTRKQIEALVDVSEFWRTVFRLESKPFKLKGYTFNNMVRTDGYSVSLQFVATDQADAKSEQKRVLADARREQAVRKAEFSVKWFDEHPESSKYDRDCAWRALENTRKDKEKNEQKLVRIGAADKRKRTREEEKAKQKAKSNSDKDKNKKQPQRMTDDGYSIAQRECEFPYFDDPVRGLPAHPEHDSDHMTFNDPGRDRWITAISLQFRFRRSSTLDPVTSSDVKANSFSYGQRHHEEITRKHRYQDINAKVRSQLGLDVLENTLANVFALDPSPSSPTQSPPSPSVENEQTHRRVHSRSMSTTDYLSYLRARNLVFVNTLQRYSVPVFRRLRWYSFLNRRRAEDKMIQDYVDHFALKDSHGKTVRDGYGRTEPPTVILGDWSRTHRRSLRGTPPVRHVGLVRLLSKRMPVYLIPEYRTSAVHHSTLTRAVNKIVEGKDPVKKVSKMRKLHAVLTPEANPNAYRPVNRDRSAATNMRIIYLHWKSTGERHPAFTRQASLANSGMSESLAGVPPPNSSVRIMLVATG